jgi:hypothetical protein
MASQRLELPIPVAISRLHQDPLRDSQGCGILIGASACRGGKGLAETED